MSAMFAISSSTTRADAVAASSEGWTLKAPAASPGARYGGVSAYDPTTNQFIYFGGYTTSGTFLGDTWNWTGTTWTQVSTTGPAARVYASMVYDPAIGKLVLFGGAINGSTYSNETWTWDGTAWTKLAISGPSARVGAAMSFDLGTNKMVLFGGQSGASTYSNETWVFNGTAWIQLAVGTTGTPPSARSGAAMSYDPATGNSVLYGGGNAGSTFNDTWVFDTNQWSQQSPSTSPGLVAYSTSDFDPGSGQVMLYGASSGSTTWAWNGSNWTAVNGGPGIRYFATMALDPRSGQLVLFGGTNGGQATSETWTWGTSVAAASWNLVSPATSPPSRSDTVMAYDPGTAQMLLYGGNSSLTDTWTWSGSNWTKLTPTTTPGTSNNPALAFDDATGQMIMFGGVNSGGTTTSLTYSWTGTNWVQLSPATSPPARWGAMLTYDPISRRLILFGGTNSAGSRINDTWAWTGTTWTQLTPASSPAARMLGAFTFDPNAGRLLLFGGESGSTQYGDTWTWNGSNWVQLTPAASPPARGGIAYMMTYNPVLGRVTLFGGHNLAGGTNYNDTWTWTGSTWAQISPTSTFTTRNAAMAAFDPRTGQIVMFGGDTGGAVTQPTYLFNVSVNAPPALTTPASLSWSATTLTGYDQYKQTGLSVSVPVPSGSKWNVSVTTFSQLTSGSNTLPALKVNGSNSSITSATAPTVTSTGSVPTSTGSVTYPVTVPLAGNAVVYGAQANTGSGTVTIPLNVWATVPANAAAGTYTNAITVSTNFGP